MGRPVEESYLEVEAIRVDDVVINDLDVEATFLRSGQVLDKLPELGSTNTVGAVNRQRALDLNAPHHSLESLGKFLIVALLSRLTILILCTQGVLAPNDIVKLRGGHELQVKEFDFRSGKCGAENRDEARARRASVAGENNASLVLHADIDLFNQLLVHISDLVERGVGKSGRIGLPFGLKGCEMTFCRESYLGSYLQHLTLDKWLSQLLRLPSEITNVEELTIGSTSLTPLSSAGLWLAVTMTPTHCPLSFLERRPASKPTVKTTVLRRSLVRRE